MLMDIPNIYTYKNLKLLISIPVVLMFIGIYFSNFIPYDTSLAGGFSLSLLTNQSVNTAALANNLSSALHVVNPEVMQSPGGISITIPMNKSLAEAESYLLAFYSYKSNYTAFNFNVTSISFALQREPNNSTLLSQLAFSSKMLNESLAGMVRSLNGELTALAPLIGSMSYNSSNVENMSSVAQLAYTKAGSAYEEKVISVIKPLVKFSSYSYTFVTPTLSRFFLSQVRLIIIVAFILVSIAVFFIFRSFVPSLAIIFGAGNDMIIALGAMGLFKIPLGIASLGGLLMLIGYSIDTEILTSIRILKRHEGTPEERAYHAMKTGLTMTTTAIATFATLFVISLIAYVPTFYEISGVVLFGLIGDIFTTWFGNASIVLLYKKKKERR
jgi:preprotein translocase subunit SecF